MPNQLPYIWHGNPYGSLVLIRITLISTTGGCDTLRSLNLTINPLLTSTTNAQFVRTSCLISGMVILTH
ncbi:MAG: hypothetical protein IPP93_08490 [Chitinophagaceae bacterium]|nr:hypothetical protein [Chitinophagaceae bacterium]